VDEKLLESIATTIADYRAGEIDAPTKEHVKRWVEQFPDGSLGVRSPRRMEPS
jgi:hypothetical protein